MLTFEAIREFERKERMEKALTKLPDDFVEQLREYLKKKEHASSDSDILELENIRNTVKRLLDARAQKILQAAFDHSRAGVEPRNLAAWEKDFFGSLSSLMAKHRRSFLEDISKRTAEQSEEAFRVLKSLPEFVGPDMKIYSLKKGDVVAIPKPLNDLLMKEGVVEKAA